MNPIPDGRRPSYITAVMSIGIFLFAVSIGGGVIGTAFAQASGNVSISQTPGSMNATQGTNVTLGVQLSVPEHHNAPAIDIDLPEGWTVVSQSSTAFYRSSEHQWLWYSGTNDTVANYTVHIPSNASEGSYTIAANGSSVNPNTSEIEWNETSSSVTVTDTICIAGAVAGDDRTIGTFELLDAIDWWAEDEPVPGTGGDTIGTFQLLDLIDAWAEDTKVSCG